MVILWVLVIEKKLLEWLEDENNRDEALHYQQTVGEKDSHKNYEVLRKEIDRREEIQGVKPKNKKKDAIVGFEGIDDEGKIEIKQRLKQEINEGLSTIYKKKVRTKKPHKPYLKSALKKSSKIIGEMSPKEESKRDKGPTGPRPFEQPEKEIPQDREGEDSDLDLLFTENDPKRSENRRLLLFQYRIKFMRGAKIFTEECITFALLI